MSHTVVLVAGPPGAGKSTLVSSLTRGGSVHIGERLGITDPEEWVSGAKNRWEELAIDPPERLLFHYDFLYTVIREDAKPQVVFSHDPALSMLSTAYDRIGVITIWCEPQELRRRISRRRRQAFRDYWMRGKFQYGWQRDRTLRKIARFYRHPTQLGGAYAAWSAFATSLRPVFNMVADTTHADTRIYDVQDWRRLASERFESPDEPQ